MFAILKSAIHYLLGFVITQVVTKLVVFFAIYAVVLAVVAGIASLIPSASVFSSALGSIPNDVWFFLDYFGFSSGAPLIVAAYATRFLIRRMPIVG